MGVKLISTIDFKKLKSRIMSNLDSSASKVAKQVLDDSKELVPRNSGALSNSAVVEKVKNIEYEVIYKKEYAAEVHEDMEAVHVTGQAKYLERVIIDKGDRALQKIAKEMLK